MSAMQYILSRNAHLPEHQGEAGFIHALLVVTEPSESPVEANAVREFVRLLRAAGVGEPTILKCKQALNSLEQAIDNGGR